MSSICPYPGLRPFNEDESIYFKGREEHVKKIISQLEERKFLMLTGASGDGKSSIVYAGIIPNARAGFFKAKYNNWVIADFRPERTPLTNFAIALTQQLELGDAAKVEKELGYGFSSLVNIYKSSSFYVDEKNEQWKNANDAEKKKLKRKGANLLILVDQFEEFFTNPENYSDGNISIPSQTVVNLLLETSKIALAEDLPIYIICTMRSDYIGQCASFRGLPEYIGYSQFFVPRLKRKEIFQVIEDPATLSGNKIANRLSETLINELGEGFDQLPVLQHALNQVWLAADTGNAQMDLVHLAKLAGLQERYLPETDRPVFSKWFSDIQPFKKPFFLKPSLENVLNAHANTLYETAADYYNSHSGNKISKEEAEFIIKKTFQSLTKIDASRAVRNRMTLQEITDIINKPNITTDMIGGVLNIFRLQGNTFLKPFVPDNEPSHQLKPTDVLDITHESLIRNWELLLQWAKEENENWLNFLDLNKQLQRWLANKKSSLYYLPLGTLSYFEKWYYDFNPNKYWLKKYDNSKATLEEKDAKAEKTIVELRNFIKSSRSAISRKRTLLIASVCTVVVILSCFTIWAVIERQKAIEQGEIANKKTEEAVRSKEEAIHSKDEALQAQQKAQVSENMAIAAKDTALQAKQLALLSKNEALVSKEQAVREAENAQKQSAIAKSEAANAEKQRQISEQEKIKAESAENKAKQLTLISVAQNISLKSASINSDAQLQGLLALQGYLFTKKNEGQVQDPVIYEGVRASYAALTGNNAGVLKGENAEVKAMAIHSDGSVSVAGKDGLMNKWDIASGKILSTVPFKYKSPVDFLTFSPDGNILVTGHENNMVCVWSTDKAGKMSNVELKGHTGLLRKAVFSPDGNYMATSGKDNTIIIWDMKQAVASNIKTIPLSSFVRAMSFIDNSTLAAGTEDGNIELITVSTGEHKKIYTAQGSMALSFALNTRKNTLIAGFSTGEIRLFDLNSSAYTNKKLSDNNTVGIEMICLNKKANMMVIACADKTIKIYDADHLDRKPILLKDHKTKVRSLAISADDRIIAGCEDKTIRVWESSTTKIADKLCAVLKRNMSSNEWKQYVGNKIEYEKTCSNL